MARTTHWAAAVAVRVPCESDRSLAEAAARRIESTPEVETATVETVSGLKPTLSATVVTVRVTLWTVDTYSETTVETALRDAPGAEQVQTVTPVE
jgi:hypothetical protein